LEKGLRIYNEAANKIMNISHYDIRLETNSNDFTINENGFFVSRDSDDTYLCSFTPSGIRFEGKTASDIPTAGGGFIELSSLASAEDVSSLRVGLSKKQNKITVNTVDITDIETADVTKLRTIVTNLINALSSSGLINTTVCVE
jgi:predicted rRNA methylase YqxC with S4 and FtsJ domains